MIETPEQFERAEEAITQIKSFLLAARRTHAPEAYAALSAPLLRELQERKRDVGRCCNDWRTKGGRTRDSAGRNDWCGRNHPDRCASTIRSRRAVVTKLLSDMLAISSSV